MLVHSLLCWKAQGAIAARKGLEVHGVDVEPLASVRCADLGAVWAREAIFFFVNCVVSCDVSA